MRTFEEAYNNVHNNLITLLKQNGKVRCTIMPSRLMDEPLTNGASYDGDRWIFVDEAFRNRFIDRLKSEGLYYSFGSYKMRSAIYVTL